MDEIQRQREGWKKKAMEVGKNIVAPRAAEIDAKGEFSWILLVISIGKVC